MAQAQLYKEGKSIIPYAFAGLGSTITDFEDVDLLEGEERKAILEDVRKWNPKCSFPTIVIGDKVIAGFKENEIKEALGI